MPLHTAQSPRETVIHRPLEWSVCCAYRDIYKDACSNAELMEFELPSGSEWMVDTIHRGASFAHQYYEALLDDYNMSEARRFPALALGTESKRILAQLFVSVQTAWGSALDRIAAESTIALPKTSAILPTLIAGLQIPSKKIVQSIESMEQRKEVERILDEYRRTGKVVQNISIEQRRVQVVRKQKPDLRPAPAEMERITITPPPPKVDDAVKIPPKASATPLVTASEPNTVVQPKPEVSLPVPKPHVRQASAATTPKAETDPPAIQSAVPASSDQAASESAPKSTRRRLTLKSPIVDAPAIGPKTAARFHSIGCTTIEDFLSANAQQLAEALNAKWITERLILQWQDQARMALRIDRLTAAGSGLLIIAGIRSTEELARQNGPKLHAALVDAAKSTEGMRLLRDQAPPPLATIERWIAAAQYTQSTYKIAV